jgi:hypothetical protein
MRYWEADGVLPDPDWTASGSVKTMAAKAGMVPNKALANARRYQFGRRQTGA